MRAIWLLLLATAAGAEVVMPLVAPGDADPWDRARDARRLAKEFVSNELQGQRDEAGQPVLDWSFELREGGFADIFCRRETEHPFSKLRLRVRNLGEPLTLAVKVADSGGAEWTASTRPLPAQSGWQTVEFPVAEWQVASWSKDGDGDLSFPLRYLAVIAFGVSPGHKYRLQVAEVSLVTPEPVPAKVGSNLPRQLKVGGEVTARLSLTLLKALPDDGFSGRGARLELVNGNAVVAAAPVAWSAEPKAWTVGQAVTGTASFSLSSWLPGGNAVWRLRLPGVSLPDAPPDALGLALGEVTMNARQPGPLKAEVKPYHGAPTIFINGQPQPGIAYAAYGPTPEVFQDFADAGVRLFSVMGTPTSHGYGLSADCWLEPGKYDYSQLDQRFRMVLDVCPDAYLFPRLYVSAPPWWLDEHPEAVVTYDPGDGQPVPYILNGRKVPSWASPVWRAAVIDALRRLIKHVESQPFADRVIGYHIASGCTEEWMMWGANENQWTDYGTDNTAAFRRWLKVRYQTEAALRQAWAQPTVTFETAVVPPKSARAKSAAGTLRDPATDTPSIDYIRYIADTTAETIDLFCGAVKQATRGERLAGIFYGYLLQLFGQRQQNAAHLGFDAVIRSPNVDFLCSPTSYMFRLLGTGTSHFMAPLSSVLAHGKLWFDENDIRTSLAPGELGAWGKPADVDGDILQQDRELANVLTNGVAQWWFDVGRNRYDDPRLMAHLKHLTEVARQTFEVDRSPIDQVAMVVDGRGLADLNVGDPLLGSLMGRQLPEIARVGASVGYYELNDVDRLKRHRLIVFAGLYEPTDAQRQAIRALQSDGRVLVFTHAPAPYHNGRWEPGGMQEICGLKLQIGPELMTPKVSYTGIDRAVQGLTGGFGIDQQTKPAVSGDDPQATVLGTLPDGRPGLLVRRYPTWTAVWSAAPAVPTALLARLADLAGAHRYVETPDVVWASKQLLAVSVNEAGPRTVRLPGPSKVTDLYGGKVVSERTTQFEVNLGQAATGLWRVEAVQ